MELLDNMVEILGEETVSRQDFRQLLETGLNQAKVALIPPSMDQVLVGDMERTRLKDIRALFLLESMREYPQEYFRWGILTELDREFFSGSGDTAGTWSERADEYAEILSLSEYDQAERTSLPFFLSVGQSGKGFKPGISD